MSAWTILRVVACIPLAFAFYIMASFFLPLRLPRIYDRTARDTKRLEKRAAVLGRLAELEAERVTRPGGARARRVSRPPFASPEALYARARDGCPTRTRSNEAQS